MSERAASPARRSSRPAPSGGAPEPLFTIGELLARLAPEFGDVSHSKVRFLEDRGLVSPQRTPSGYRKYTAADVERLRVVLRLQRDQYMPLRVIREHLAALDADPAAEPPAAAPRGEAPTSAPASAAPSAGPSAAASAATEALGASTAAAATAAASGALTDGGPHDVSRHGSAARPGEGPAAGTAPVDGRADADEDADPHEGVAAARAARREPVARAEVLAEAGGSLALLEALEDHGLLPRESAGRYPRSAVDLVRAAVVLGDHGIEPRHLRALRTAVGAEAALVEQVVSPLRRSRPGERPERSEERADDAERVALELVTSLLSLHAAALGCALDGVPPS